VTSTAANLSQQSACYTVPHSRMFALLCHPSLQSVVHAFTRGLPLLTAGEGYRKNREDWVVVCYCGLGLWILGVLESVFVK
jgi:hypothetical protein